MDSEGPTRPFAYSSIDKARAPSAVDRIAFIRPVLVSATKISPLGATVMILGATRSDVNTLTLKPFGTRSAAVLGLGTILGM